MIVIEDWLFVLALQRSGIQIIVCNVDFRVGFAYPRGVTCTLDMDGRSVKWISVIQ